MTTARCRHCGREMPEKRHGKMRKACSNRCAALSRPYPVAERLWPRVNKSGAIVAHMSTPCWEWMGNVGRAGYGSISIHNKPHLVHRVAWELHSGPIPGGLWVLHHCDNRRCVNPEHLYLGTVQQNADDMWRRGRAYRGPRGHVDSEEHHKAKLTWRAVAEIRRRHAAGETFAALGRAFGVYASTVRSAVLRKNWRGQERLEEGEAA